MIVSIYFCDFLKRIYKNVRLLQFQGVYRFMNQISNSISPSNIICIKKKNDNF